jgi:tyrosyl-tRNA synthetase
MLKSDLTIVGSDQLFNESMGRFFQEKFNELPQAIVTLKLLPGLDGKEKMSKSYDNYIGVADSPREKFGKAMSLPDSLLFDYLAVYTDVSLFDIEVWKERISKGENPMQAKLFFAQALVRRYHGEEISQKEQEYFTSLFSKKEIPENIPEVHIRANSSLIDLIMATHVVSSKSQARRLIEQRAVEIDGEVLTSPNEKIDPRGKIVKIGKKHFFKVI